MMKPLICTFLKNAASLLIIFLLSFGCNYSPIEPIPKLSVHYFMVDQDAFVSDFAEEHKNISKDKDCSLDLKVQQSEYGKYNYTEAPKDSKGNYVVSEGIYDIKLRFECKQNKKIKSITTYVDASPLWGKRLVFYPALHSQESDKSREEIFTDDVEKLDQYVHAPIRSCQYTNATLEHHTFVQFSDGTSLESIYNVRFDTLAACTILLDTVGFGGIVH